MIDNQQSRTNLLTYAQEQAQNHTCYLFFSRYNEFFVLKEICQNYNADTHAIDIVAYTYNPSYKNKFQPIGNISAQITTNPTESNLHTMALSILTVNKEYKNHGLGHALISLMQKRAIDFGCVSIKSIFQPHGFLQPNNPRNVSYLKKFYGKHGLHLRVYREEDLIGKELYGNFRSPTIKELYHKTLKELSATTLSENIKIYNPFHVNLPPEIQSIQKRTSTKQINAHTANIFTTEETNNERAK